MCESMKLSLSLSLSLSFSFLRPSPSPYFPLSLPLPSLPHLALAHHLVYELQPLLQVVLPLLEPGGIVLRDLAALEALDIVAVLARIVHNVHHLTAYHTHG